jgi:2-phosphoglycerate kinase
LNSSSNLIVRGAQRGVFSVSTEERQTWPHIAADLKDRMVFIGGPRQVGKTTIAQSFIANYRNGAGYRL